MINNSDKYCSTTTFVLIFVDFGKCGSGQISHGSFCYEFNSNEVDWSNAKRDCQSKNGDLASIHSSVEQAFIASKSAELNKDMWIGM